jgi:nicotinamide-nucleotide amidase
MEAIVEQIHKSLLKKRKTIAVAESCTGGLLSSLLTKKAGSSEYFIGGVVAYSNKAKVDALKIPRSVIVKNGAVSGPVVKLMAQRIRKLAKTDFGIGITGIAGPAGGTPRKPVGTVFIAVDSKDKRISGKFHFTGSRNAIRKKTALKSLELLKRLL